ncbi:hypothetical protein Emtol_3491 [Emticicia oligotrophica DSM 17448]|uniref:DUF2157 domain-containing protein n=1 Tax=Emticicia oligotrophica (strain DSM 17448 / CIP 109782 / MTCC 6937 / GPTSA100-15) TaxID=929562 RepID=A0ABN4AQJ5_EMTOG|nr:hypothetical protein [Emticicia oligotrophica]AFK04619.1 hypothetical protein Emtol_3491 [Emticicia oligotrophica DSM 17448]
MKAYNETWVDNISYRKTVDDWYSRNLISSIQHQKAYDTLPIGFHQSNVFIKIGLFLFTCIVASAALGFISLFLLEILSDTTFSYSVISLLYAFVFLFFLEYFIKKNSFYRSGVDNALLYATICAFFVAIIGFLEINIPIWSYCLIAVIILLPALIRYADPLVALGLYLSLIGLCFFSITQYNLGKTIIPFVIILVSGALYLTNDFWAKKVQNYYYQDCQTIIEVLTLITFYLGGNYFIVREGNAFLNDLDVSVQITFAPLFCIFSTIIPILYIIWGLFKHNRSMLVVGMAALGFAIFTFRFYNSFIPIQWALCIGGSLLICLCIIAIRSLKAAKFGITSEAIGVNELKNLEAFIVNQALQQPTQPNKVQFGKGDFGGGGSGSNY